MADVFLIYVREDAETARRLADAMQARGLDVWWDAENPPGETWDRRIERELAAARCAVVLWSKVSVRKTWVRTEATEAQKRSVLIPVLLDAVQQPIAFRRTQTVSLVGWTGGDDHKGLRQLLGAVQRLVRDPGIAPEAAVRDAENEPPGPTKPASQVDAEPAFDRPTSAPPNGKRRRWLVLAGVGAAAVAAVVGFLVLDHQAQVAPAQRTVTTVNPVSPAPDPVAQDPRQASRANGQEDVGSDIPGRYPFTSERYITDADLRTLSNADLKIMRNEILARHGYIFETDAMKRYFSRQPWYRPQSDNVIDRLSPVELANVEAIKAVENSR